MMKHRIHFFLLLLCFNYIAEGSTAEGEESGKKKIDIVQPTMGPNSKFLNPHLDDATNLQLAIAAFEEDQNKPDGKAEEVLAKVSEGLSSATSGKFAENSRTSKTLDNFKLISLLNSLIRGEKNYKFKNL